METSTTAQTLRELADSRSDALDRLLYSDLTAQGYDPKTGDLLVLEDSNLALTLWALADILDNHSRHRVYLRQRSYAEALAARELIDSLGVAEHAVIAGFPTPQAPQLGIYDFLHQTGFTGRFVAGRLPKSHGALADWAQDIARYQVGADTSLILTGNTKHMSKNFNQTLASYFEQVQGLRGKGKHRSLLAQDPRAASPASEKVQQGELKGFGGVFSGSKADHGGQLLAQVAGDLLTTMNEVTLLDFGCGNGSVTLDLLKDEQAEPHISRVFATDVDADAIRSAAANLGFDERVHISWDGAASSLPDSSIDLVLLNPPFHEGTRIDLTLVQPLLDAAARVLKPGGTLLLVHNSYARYRPELEERFASVRQASRNKLFTVLEAHKLSGE